MSAGATFAESSVKPLRLPGPVSQWLDRLSSGLMRPPGMEMDFALPPGEPALAAPGSVSWRVFKNPVAMFIGGVAAVILELAEPRVRDGVWQHSTFRRDPMSRLQRTGLAAMVTVYGAHSTAEAMISGVVRAHARVAGTTNEGLPYEANDPELLLWVQATATFGFLSAYDRFVHRLGDGDMERGIAEAAPSARLYGVEHPPFSEEELGAIFERMDPHLVATPVIHEFLRIMGEVEALPKPLRLLQRIMLKAGVSLLPPPLVERLGLTQDWQLWGWERALVTTVARVADRLVLPSAPSVQACRRLGLPPDWLYRRR